MIRKGSLVTFDVNKSQNSVYIGLGATGMRFKVEAVRDRAGRKVAVIGGNIKVPVDVLKGIPQKRKVKV